VTKINNMRFSIRFILLATILTFSLSSFSQNSINEKLNELDEYFEQAGEDWEVPGLAVAIVKNDEIVFSKGYGTKNVETGEPVDGNTLFAIASNTKAFTAAALAILVDEGKLSWDDKVRDYLPWFELYDPYVSDHFTIRDLLSHRSGLATFSGDLVWYGSGYSREEVVRRAKHLEPVYGFRERFGYNNIMYIAAGLVVEEISGMSWDDFITGNILQPLGMDRTITSTNDLDGMENVSMPHNDYQEDVIVIEWLNWDNVAPAGSLISSANDVAKWLIFNLNRGILENGDTLIEPERFREMWAPVTLREISARAETMWPSTHFRAYGLGWGMQDYLGRKALGHSGGYDGFISYSVFVPEDDLGFVILTNKNSALYYALIYKILDEMLDAGEEKDWSNEILSMMKMRDKSMKEQAAREEAERTKGTSPTLPTEAYLGTYTSKLYGDAEVYMDGEQMRVQLKPTEIFNGRLDHWEYNTWQIEFEKVTALPKGRVNFTIGMDGGVTEMLIDVPNPDFDFTELKFLKR
jgi:CubicO group peptidase (beta-lactamase class C family)